jgi:Ca2+-binding EF-hand superfamily protein
MADVGRVDVDVFQRYQAFVQCADERTRFLRQEVEEHAREVFSKANLRRDGQLSLGELAHAMQFYNLHTVPELSDPTAFRAFVLSSFEAYEQPWGSGTVNFDSFCQLVAALRDRYAKYMPEINFRVVKQDTGAAAAAKATVNEFDTLQIDKAAIRRIFHLFDADKSGALDAQEICAIAKEMGIPDYERDGYKGFIIRSIKEHLGDKNDEDDGKLLEHEFDFTEFTKLLCSLVTCKVDRNYRKYILSKSIARGVLDQASPKKKEGKGKGRNVLQKAGMQSLGV